MGDATVSEDQETAWLLPPLRLALPVDCCFEVLRSIYDRAQERRWERLLGRRRRTPGDGRPSDG